MRTRCIEFGTSSTPAVSAVKVLESAIEQGKGVYDLDEGNLEDQLALMDLPYWAEDQIRDHVEGGYHAKAPGGLVSQDEWSGVGYVFWKGGDGGCVPNCAASAIPLA